MLEIERLEPRDWPRLRAIRLAALGADPDAFGSTLADEQARPDTFWQGRMANDAVAQFVANVDGDDVGIAVCSPWRDELGIAGLFGMWVAPAARRAGTGRALVDAIVSWAGREGHERLRLDVWERNHAATALYVAAGFEPTGRTSTHPPPREHLVEVEYELALRRGNE